MAAEEIGRRPGGRGDDVSVRVRRVYDEPSEQDGTRVLVDRVWPRGLRKVDADLDEWCKEVAPSTELRKWYGHDPVKFDEFRRRYRVELTQPERAQAVQHLRSLADVRGLTLLTATHDPDISQAAVLADLLCRPSAGSVEERASAFPAPESVPDGDREPGSSPRGRIVVGVDGSTGAQAALQWAVKEARLRSQSVRAVMAWHYSPAYGDAWIWPTEGPDAATVCEEVLDSVLAELPQSADLVPAGPSVEITSTVVEGHPGQALLSAAEEADLLVVGSRGRGGLVGALLGSVSQHVVAHATCPVVVVPDPARRHGIHGAGRLAS